MLNQTNNKITVLILDDDAGMRLLLRKIVEQDDRFECVTEAACADDAIEQFRVYHPQLVFSDIDLPDGNGVDSARKIHEIDPMTKIVFVTAYEQYMADAFSVYAFDYIIKPFDIQRVKATLNAIYDILNRTHIKPILTVSDKNIAPDKLVVKTKESYSFINMEDIILIQREDRSTVIYTINNGRYVTKDTLSDIMGRLDKSYLIRSHKSYIINVNKITDIYVYGRWTYLARFSGTTVDALITSESFEIIKQKYNIN